MKAYLRKPQERDKIPMRTLLFLGEDRGYNIANQDCLVSNVGTNYFFDWGLDEHERVAPQIASIRAGRINDTSYTQVEVDDQLANETIRLGENYRTGIQGNGDRVTIHKLSDLIGKPVPRHFQDKAAELFCSLQI